MDVLTELYVDSSSSKWSQIVSENEMIIVNYHSDVYCPVCKQINAVFISLANDKEYEKIRFVIINTDNNPIADQYIRRKKLPFVALFKHGLLLECNSIQTEQSLISMLETLLTYQLKI